MIWPAAVAVACAMMTTFSSASALAEVRFVRGQFAERVERGQPIGDGVSARASGQVAYFLVCNNNGAQEDVTIEWIVNGRSVQRQMLSIGHAPRWRTWATRRVGRAAQVAVKITNAAGTVIHEETLTGNAG